MYALWNLLLLIIEALLVGFIKFGHSVMPYNFPRRLEYLIGTSFFSFTLWFNYWLGESQCFPRMFRLAQTFLVSHFNLINWEYLNRQYFVIKQSIDVLLNLFLFFIILILFLLHIFLSPSFYFWIISLSSLSNFWILWVLLNPNDLNWICFSYPSISFMFFFGWWVGTLAQGL